MTYVRYIPSSPLNSHIEDFYYLDGPAPYPRQKVLPAVSLNTMINLGEPFQVYKPDQVNPFITCTESWWVGLWNTYHVVNWPMKVKLYGIHFKPGGAYPFLQFPLSELSGQVVPLDAIWGHHAGEIRERLHAAPTIQAGFALLERLMLTRLTELPHGLDVVQYAITEITRNDITLSIRGLSDRIGISENHLGTLFKRLVGLPPKELTRLYRFRHVLRSIDPVQPVDWTRLAHDSGFYDQSHFNKDFVAFTGQNPTDYLRLYHRVTTVNRAHTQIYRTLPID